MSSQIDFRTLPNNVPSLCIPRVFANWTEARIRRVFDDLGMGEIQRIDVVSKSTEKGEKFNRVFVHFKRWFSNQNADMARERLLNGKEIKIVYDDPWFWKVSAYREANKKVEHHPDREERPRASIRFDDDRRPVHHDRRPVEHDRRPVHHDRRDESDRRPVKRDRRQVIDNKPSHEAEPRDRRNIKSNTKEVVDKQHEHDDISDTKDNAVVSTSAKDINEGLDINYGQGPFPIPKRRNVFIKKEPVAPIKIKIEEGEIVDEAVVENK
jgi:hypothetical protein